MLIWREPRNDEACERKCLPIADVERTFENCESVGTGLLSERHRHMPYAQRLGFLFLSVSESLSCEVHSASATEDLLKLDQQNSHCRIELITFSPFIPPASVREVPFEDINSVVVAFQT